MAVDNENATKPPQVPPTPQAPHTLSTIKLHILKKGNGPIQVSTYTNGQIRGLPPKTAEEILAKERERKAKTTLLKAIPEDHLAKFHKMTDAKEMWEAIKYKFGRNDESKKMQKYILKQQFEGFSVSNLEGLHKGYNRFQSLLSQLENHGAGVSTEDANQKFLRTLTSSWSQVSLIMRTKPGVDTLSFDDLYNNLRVFEYDVKECRSKENQESRRSDAGNTRYKARDNERRPTKQDEHKAMVTIDGEVVDWTGHAEDDTEDYALMAFNSRNSGSDTKVTSCSKVCENTYAKLKKLYDEQREQLGVASIEIQAYTLALKMVEAQLVCHQKNRLAYEEKISRSSDVENSPVNDRFAKVKGMHAVPPSMIRIYMPPKSNFGINESKFTRGPKQSQTSESDAKTNDLSSCESNSSVETLESMPKLVESKPRTVSEPRVWSDAPIIKEYESASDDECVFKATMEQEKPGCTFINTVKHVKTPRQTVKDKDTCSQNPKDNPHQTLKGKGIVNNGCSRHMTRNKAYLVEYQDFNGGPIAFGGSKGQIIGKGTKREYSNARTSQKNRVAKSRNRNLIEAARTMLADSFLPNTFWVEAFSIACYVLNRVSVTKPQNKTPYELLIGKIPITSYIRPFGCHVTILNTIDHLVKFKEKSDEGFLVGYSLNSKPVTAKNKGNKIAGPKEANTSAEAKNGDENLNGGTGSKTNKEPVDHEDQAFLEELKNLKRQEKEANDEAKTLRKTFAQNTKDLLLQAGAARASSTNYFNTISTPVNTASTPIPSLKDIYEVPNDGIFTSASYDDKGVVADFTNLESTVNEELLQFKTQQVWILVDLPFGKKMSSLGELAFFLRLQVKQREDGIFISQDKYVAEILKKFDFISVKTTSTLIVTKKPLVKDTKPADVGVHLYRSMIGSLMYLTASRPDIIESDFDLEAYSNSDYAGVNLDKKSTTEGFSKKSSLGKEHVSKQGRTKAKTRTNIEEGDFNKLDDLVDEGVDYVVNEGMSTDKIKVLNADKIMLSRNWLCHFIEYDCSNHSSPLLIINSACDQVEFQRISLTGFRSCASCSHYRNVSKKATRRSHGKSASLKLYSS
nr:ribonuclease H-like domain-containing protein [Tanacetum cinerariifolium]